VTVAIGILALVVACLTIFQSVLAAGPGRLKASTSAIDYYARYTTSTFNWQELRVRTTTKVPFIDIPNLIDEAYARLIFSADGRIAPIDLWTSSEDSTHEMTTQLSGAGWANLLNMFHHAADVSPFGWSERGTTREADKLYNRLRA